MKYNLEYWKEYYTNKGKQDPSSFSRFCMNYIKSNENILDICCGEGRDSRFFHSNNIETYAFDINNMKKVPFNFKQFNLQSKKNNFSLNTKFDNVYCRFTLHAITEDLEDYVLINSNNVLKQEGLLFIEARSNKGVILNEINDHYRRLIDIDLLKFKLSNINFEIIYEEESDNLSIYGQDNPILIRIVAKKKNSINVSSDISFEKFHSTCGKLNKKSAKHLLLSTKKILQRNSIPFLLVFGTLLGAYRDKDFIDYDEDVDIMLFDYSKFIINGLIDQGYFAIYGLINNRKHQNILYSFQYKDDYIDLYFFRENQENYRCGPYYIEKDQINNGFSRISFLNKNFYTVNNIEKYLIDKYGDDWNIPIENKSAAN